jgi:hypothetical protein
VDDCGTVRRGRKAALTTGMFLLVVCDGELLDAAGRARGPVVRVAAVIDLHRQVPSVLATNVVFVVLYVPLSLTLTVCVKAGVLSVP